MRTLAQVPESEATGSVRAIYEDMRRAMRLPLVNLIYRHMATMPGVLPWAWSLIRPLVVSGAIEGGANRMIAALPTPRLSPITTDDLRRAGLNAENEMRVLQVLAAYNRGNTFNLINLTTLRAALDGNPIRNEAHPDAPSPEFAPPDIPPIPRASDLDAETAARLDGIARLHGGDGVLPSFYLHLANWPEYLAVVCEHLEPALRDGRVARSQAEACRLARAEAVTFAPLLSTTVPTPSEYLPALREALDTFVDHLIPEMVPVGLAISGAMPQPSAPS